MRLTCPNCDAQYEVPSEVIPDEGRDVQCSNCGETWFQDAPLSETQQDTRAPSEYEAVADPASEDETQTFPSGNVNDIDATPEAPQPRREIDPAITQLLREEAERETALRANVDTPLETQTEMGLAMPSPQPEATEDTDSEAREHSQPELPEVAPVALRREVVSPRRDTFPDIETVNSSLVDNTDHVAKSPTAHEGSLPTRRGGFAPGFSFALAAMFIAVVIYANATALAELLPPFETSLKNYVSWVDTLRIWLDGQVGALSDAMDKHKT